MPESTKSEENRRTSKQESRKEEESESSSEAASESSDDLKEREYRDNQGQIHHHTKKYMEAHEGEEGGGKEEE